jgi:Ulp1 family protease
LSCEWQLDILTVPQQFNGDDCGVFVAQFAKALASDTLELGVFSPDVKRTQMKKEILNLRLIDE